MYPVTIPQMRCVVLTDFYSSRSLFYGYENLHSSEVKPLAEREQTIWIEGVIDSPVRRDGDAARFLSR